jgi:hypothetical protein
MASPEDNELTPGSSPILHVLPPTVVRMLQRHFYAGTTKFVGEGQKLRRSASVPMESSSLK